MGRILHQRKSPAIQWPSPKSDYESFDQLNGQHSWQDAVPAGYVPYSVRKLNEGRVTYFNFSLAKEMGLIPENHPHKMSKQLESKLIETFSIRIINEYDQKQNVRFHPAVMKQHKYMATRYLQLQHKDKRGTTSGDGRSIWNGQIQHKGTIWDVSSRGTGVTRLAPGAVEAQKPLKSGSTSFGYGCGLADIDELIGAAIMAEIFHNSGINTERVLAVIDTGNGHGIGVRAGKNLFRPAHLFMFLKQGNIEALRSATDFLIDRQFKNKEWNFNLNTKRKYDLMLKEITENFAQFAAQLERDYIFAWLDWDGDNVLANAGIIDYGSIRQFGLRHDQYRYDDVDRYSTNMQEQKYKARATVQTFAQLVDFLNTGRKQPLKNYSNHWAVAQFEMHFEYYILDRFLYQLGLSRPKRELLLTKNIDLIKSFYSEFLYLERVKTKRKAQKVPDGINKPAIFNMRKILYLLPEHMLLTLSVGEIELLSERDFFEIVLAKSARGKDRILTQQLRKRIRNFQHKYWEVIARSAGDAKMRFHLSSICERAINIHHPNRITGDGLLYIVDEILKFKKQGGKTDAVQSLIDQIIEEHSFSQNTYTEKNSPRLHINRRTQAVLKTMLTLVDDLKESI